jgi:hypothetical protein
MNDQHHQYQNKRFLFYLLNMYYIGKLSILLTSIYLLMYELLWDEVHHFALGIKYNV